MKKSLFCALAATSLLLLTSLACQIPNLNVTPPKDKTFFAVYMVGSDLEDDVKPRNGIPDEEEKKDISTSGAGSNDLREIVASFDDMKPEDKSNIELYVGFGGARKKGWKGIKYADVKCLQSDSEDDYFGNADCYLKKDEKANMGEQKTLIDFLKFVKEKSQGYDKKVLVFWDHGAAYSGVGFDTNFKNDGLTISELNGAFTETQFKPDLVAFDACLMGNLEVVNVMKNFATYMLGSEELVPGHGWQYTEVINYITTTPKASIVDIGKKIVDIFITSEKHTKSKNKTLALLDLKKADSVIKAVDSMALNFDIKSFANVLSSIKTSEKYGELSQDESYSMDLKTFSNNLSRVDNSFTTQAQDISSAISKMVLYARHDSTKPNANGISIFSLSNNSVDSYKQVNPLTHPWNSFVNTFVNLGRDDKVPPVINSETACELNGIPGYCVNITDNVGLSAVNIEYSIIQKDGGLMVIGSDQVSPIDKKGTYYFAKWEGEWVKLCDGECNDTNELTPPLYFLGITEKKELIYIADCLYNKKPATVYIELDKNSNISKSWVVPYDKLPNGDKLISKTQFDLSKGDTIQFNYNIIDEKQNTQSYKLGNEIMFTNNPSWKFGYVQADALSYIGIAKDYKGNIKLSKPHNLIASN